MEEDASAALADKALAAFVIIHAMLKRSRRLQTFCERPDIRARFPGYAVNPLCTDPSQPVLQYLGRTLVHVQATACYSTVFP